MSTDHWFDALNKLLVNGTSRRVVPLAASVLAARTLLDVTAPVGAGKKKHKNKNRHKDKNKGKDKGNKDQKKDDPWGCKGRLEHLRIKDPNCSGGDCKAQWPDDPCEEKYCEFICNQCDGEDTRQFCVSEVLPGEKIAVCCTDGAACCDGMCCGGFEHPELKCCQDGCKATNNDRQNCGSCGNRCAPEENCVDGRCIDQCDQYCADAPGVSCCNGRCVSTSTDDVNCGECGVVCEGRLYCKDGACRECEDGYKVCDPTAPCVPESWSCCGHRACHPTLPCCGSGDDAYCGQFGTCP